MGFRNFTSLRIRDENPEPALPVTLSMPYSEDDWEKTVYLKVAKGLWEFFKTFFGYLEDLVFILLEKVVRMCDNSSTEDTCRE